MTAHTTRAAPRQKEHIADEIHQRLSGMPEYDAARNAGFNICDDIADDLMALAVAGEVKTKDPSYAN